MHYFGGKFRIRYEISVYINSFKPKIYLEPFCGSCWIAENINSPIRICSDLHPDLIALWKAIQKGKIPPSNITKEEYYRVKSLPSPNALKGFVGFGCSDSGKWFGGYAKTIDRPFLKRNYATNAKNQLLKRIKNLQDVKFYNLSYEKLLHLSYDIAYCDPPYQNTTAYGGLPKFDSDKFWDDVRQWSIKGKHIIVSEYIAPNDFICVKEILTRLDINGSGTKRLEKLWVHKSLNAL